MFCGESIALYFKYLKIAKYIYFFYVYIENLYIVPIRDVKKILASITRDCIRHLKSTVSLALQEARPFHPNGIIPALVDQSHARYVIKCSAIETVEWWWNSIC